MDHLLTQQRGRCGPLIDPTAKKQYIYIYILFYSSLNLSSFLLCCLSCFGPSFFVSFLPCLLLLFHEKNKFNILNWEGFFHQSFLLWVFLSYYVFQIPFPNRCFLTLSCVFVQHQSFHLSNKRQLRKHQCLVKLGVATFFFNNLCF